MKFLTRQRKKPPRSKVTNPGAFLREVRLARGDTAKSVAKRLGLSLTKLHELEEWEASKLPQGLYLRGLLNEYGTLLNVEDDEGFLALVERAVSGSRGAKVGLPRELKDKRQVAVTRLGLLGIALLITVGVLAYLSWQGLAFFGRPRLDIYEPVNGTEAVDETVPVKGKVTEGTQVYINGANVLVQPDGSFESHVILQEGANDIEIRALNSFSNEAKAVRTVIYRPVDEQG